MKVPYIIVSQRSLELKGRTLYPGDLELKGRTLYPGDNCSIRYFVVYLYSTLVNIISISVLHGCSLHFSSGWRDHTSSVQSTGSQ